MLSIYSSFLESANVNSEHPSGIVFPFGSVSLRSKILSKFQNMSKKDPEEQVKLLKSSLNKKVV